MREDIGTTLLEIGIHPQLLLGVASNDFMSEAFPLPAFKRTTMRPRLHNYQVDASESNVGNRPIAGSERVFSGSVRPNGQGSFGFCRRKGEQARERTLSRDRKAEILAINYLDWDEYPGEGNTTRVVRCDKRVSGRTPLTLSEPLMGRKGNHRVAKGLTTQGKRKMESAVHLLAHKYGTKNIGFYTLTCPFDEVEDIDAFNDAFPTIVKRYLEKIKRYYTSIGRVFSYVGVHEIQPERYAKSGKACLHFHYLAPCKMGLTGKFILSTKQVRDWYREAIDNALPGRKYPSPRIGAEVCRKSASGYLAKYYSKGVAKDANQLEVTRSIRLSSWYVVSRNLLRAVQRAIFRVDGTLANDVIRHYEGKCGNSDITFSRAIRVCRDGCERLVGYVFAMSAKFMSAWLRHCMYEISAMI